MYRERFTNKEWNNLNWKDSGFIIGENGINACYQVAEKLGYVFTNQKDYFEHNLYKKDGKIYFIENRNGGVQIALANFKGEYIEKTYVNKKDKTLYSGELVGKLVEQGKNELKEFELINKKHFLFDKNGKVKI